MTGGFGPIFCGVQSRKTHGEQTDELSGSQTHRLIKEGLKKESWLFQQLLSPDEAITAMRRFLAEGDETPDAEQRVGALNVELY